MDIIQKTFGKMQEFYSLSRSLDGIYLSHVTNYNTRTITIASILTVMIELVMITRLFISHPAIDTPASRTYFLFYLSLIIIASIYLLVQARIFGKLSQTYWLQFLFVASYLLWNVLLNSYDLFRNGQGSSLALVSAIVFASILIHFRPHHMMILQGAVFILFFVINNHRIEDKINASIAVTVAIVANLLFYIQEIYNVHSRQQLTLMTSHLEKEQMDGAMQYLKRLQEAQTQTAIYHHDLRHTLNLVEQLAIQGNLDRIRDFVSDSQEALNSPSPSIYCQHETVNLILGSFAQRAASNHVAFNTEIHLPEMLPLSDTQLCALLCNLLENALHSVKCVENTTPRHIYVKIIVSNGRLVILVENDYVGTILMKNGTPISQNQDGTHGFGVQSIIHITERHHGIYVFETEGQLFRAKILLHL